MMMMMFIRSVLYDLFKYPKKESSSQSIYTEKRPVSSKLNLHIYLKEPGTCHCYIHT